MDFGVAAEITSPWLPLLIGGIVLVCLLALFLWRRSKTRNSAWEKESIPDDAILFMRVHRSLFPDGEIIPYAFTKHGDPPGMSTDWNRHSTAEECRQRARQVGKLPENYAVIWMPVSGVRNIPGQTVEHTPIYQPPIVNRAHTDVFGDDDEEARLSLLQISHIALPLVS
jgi:hypothetical protein